MSTFDGIIKEYPLISIDSFIKNNGNFESTVFFLSHCHTDHMKGLSDSSFYQLLESRYFSKIYVSEVSKHLLENSDAYCHLAEYLESIPLEQPKIIAIPNKNGEILSRVTVTLVAAGHCLGSVMIYIEGENGRILYTGDFRLPVGDAARLVNLHDGEGRLKPLDALYVDTTFCKKQYMYFPTREQGLESVISLVEPWLAKGSDHIISLICSAKYNYEFVFVELFKKFHQKIHISEERLRQYRGIKIIEDAVTTVETESRIHACRRDKTVGDTFYISAAPCGYETEDLKPIKVKYIKLCAWSFKHGAPDSTHHMYIGKEKMHKVCFSTHSSLAEVRDLVSYLKPKIVYPNVVQGQTVEEILELINVTSSQDLSSPELQFSISPLGELRNMTPDDKCTTLNSNSLPFYDDYYRISVQNQSFYVQPTQTSTADKKGDINLDNSDKITKESFPMGYNKLDLADSSSAASKPNIIGKKDEQVTHNSSNTKKSNEIVLHKESKQCELLNVTDHSSVVVKSKSCDTSPIKWNFPSLSSDDENCDPNSSFGSSKDKSDSETTYTTSEEQDLKMQDLDCAMHCNLKIQKSSTKIIESSKGQIVEETSKVCKKGVIEKSFNSIPTTSNTYFVHNTTNSPDKDFNDCIRKVMPNTDVAVIKEMKPYDITSEDYDKKINCRFINKSNEKSQEEMRFIKPVGEISRNESHPSKKKTAAMNASMEYSVKFNPRCEKSRSYNYQGDTTKYKMQTSEDKQSSELLIEISDGEDSDSPPDLQVVFTQINSKKNSPYLNSYRDKNFGNNSSDNISNFSNINKLDLVNDHIGKSCSFTNNSIITKKNLSADNGASNLNEQMSMNEHIKKSQNDDIHSSSSKSFSCKSSEQSGQKQCDLQAIDNPISHQYFFIRKTSQDLGNDLYEDQYKFVRKVLPDLSSRMFSHKLPDISASKYERIHSKFKLNKTSNTVYTASESSNGNKNNHKNVELIDLSSDDSVESSPPKFVKPKYDIVSTNSKFVYKNNKISSNRKISDCDIADSSSDIEVLDDSPSLLDRTRTKKNCNDSVQSSNGTKRKCAESSDVPAQKSPKLEEDDSPDIFDGNCDYESTPEDLLSETNF
ncbi:protein artemis-like [Argiope bruennichi]|uniref:protein artemis-like n=1 Tax=Argiope bruennichi TaxID=94029 RepID=UPI002494C556|nr:protein artemis-like [Argiope bruennichi]